MKTIASRDNPTVKALRALAKDGRTQRLSGHCLLEGPHLLVAYLDRVGLPELVAVSESAIALPEVATLLDRLPGCETLCLRDTVFREVSDLATPQGIFARVAVPPAPTLPQNPVDWVLLDALQDAGNVGTILRTAAAAGFHHVALGTGCAHAWMPKTLRAAQGAHFSLSIHESVDLAAFLAAYDGLSVAAVAHDGSDLYALELIEPVAWLFGNEGSGIAPGLVDCAKATATIPLAAGNESLNVSAAAAACLFETRRQRLSIA